MLFALGLLLAVLTFTAVTLLIGQPFYENLSERVDADVSPDGTAPARTSPRARAVDVGPRQRPDPRPGAGLGVLLFALGLLPFVGQTVVPVLGFFVTGFFLTEELTAVASSAGASNSAPGSPCCARAGCWCGATERRSGWPSWCRSWRCS